MEPLITYYLEMTSSTELKAKALPTELSVVECEHQQYPFNRFLYQLVGGPWGWTDKLSLTDAEWQRQIESPDHRTWVAYHRGAIAGYYELQRQGNDVEILYFGLVEQFFGRGFGGPLLSHAIEQAWNWAGCERVWVHTCSLDHPSALLNYQARGLRLYHEQVEGA